MSRLVDGDLPSGVFLGLRDENAENAVLHGSLNVLGVDADGEGEASGEFTNAALADPVFLLRLHMLGLVLLPLLGNLGVFGWSGCIGGVVSIFDGGSMVGLGFVGDGSGGLGSFDEARRRCTGSEGALGAAADNDGLRIGELNFNILLVDTWQFAVELVAILHLLDIELRSEGLHDVAAAAVFVVVWGALAVGVEVVKETEERVEGGRVAGGDEVGRQERHFACVGCCEKSMGLSDRKS
jgi:hypothetical protein